MLQIRQEQWDAFAEAGKQAYIERAWLRLNRVNPELCDELGEDAIRLKLRTGLDRAEHYGITKEADINQYIDLMIEWGDDFDVSPETPWASEVLNWKDADGSTKVRALGRASGEAYEKRLSLGVGGSA